MSENFYSELRARFPRDLRTIAIETVTGQYYRYSDIDSQSARLANALTVLGVRPGERVAVQVEKSPEALLLYLACLRAGGVYLPLNTGYTQTELAYFLNDAEPAVLVCSPEQQAALAPLAQRYGVAHVMTLGTEQDGNLLELAAQQSAEFTDAACSRDDLAAILYTSGTTGRSKGAMLTHGNLAFSACVLCQVWAFNERDVLLHALPLFHVHGLFVATHCTLMSASRMIFFPRFDLDALLAALPRATVLMGVPTFYTRLLGRSDFTRERCRGMRLFISGSAPLSAETHREFRERTGYAILERYGMTETNMLTSNPYYGERIAGSVGLPLPGVEVRIADLETGAVLPAGAIGVIKVRGPNVFKGYWRMPEKTAQEFRADGFFITGI
jgi:malonyl-CoA/methylmalonyl-CoA synthetase